MQPESTNTKKIVIGIVLLALTLFAGWFFFFRNTGTEVVLDEFGNPVQIAVVGKDLIDLLAELQSVTLDPSIFKTAGFLNLTDFAVELPNQPIGRKNPFQSLSGTAASSAGTNR